MKYLVEAVINRGEGHAPIPATFKVEVPVDVHADNRLTAISEAKKLIRPNYDLNVISVTFGNLQAVERRPETFDEYLHRFGLSEPAIRPTESDIQHSRMITEHGAECRKTIAEYAGWLERWRKSVEQGGA